MEVIDTGNEDTDGDGDGFLIVYDVCDRSSFVDIPNLVDEINKAKELVEGGSLNLPSIVLVGNKSDMSDRNVGTEEGRKTAEALKCGFGETTAKGSVEHVFCDVIQRHRSPSSCNEGGRYDWTCGLFTGSVR